jgi:NTE family protein
MKNLFKLVILIALVLTIKESYGQALSNKNLLIVSGGGARGAWGAGVVEYLLSKNDGYRCVYGTSTGSLIAPLALLKDTVTMCYLYTHLTQKEIFNVSPFKKSKETRVGDNIIVTTEIKGLPFLVRRLILHKKTLGETYPLKKLIADSFTLARFEKIINSGCDLNVAVGNVVSGQVEIKSTNDYKNKMPKKEDTIQCKKDMCDWLYASACEPIWMSYLYKNDSIYTDGGINEVIPVLQGLRYAFKNGIKTVDVVINNSSVGIDCWPENENHTWLDGLKRVLDILPTSISNDDIKIAELMTQLHNCKDAGETTGNTANGNTIQLNIYFMPQNIANTYENELGFNQDAMTILWHDGLKNPPAPLRYYIDQKDYNTLTNSNNIKTQ